MKLTFRILLAIGLLSFFACTNTEQQSSKSAAEILGNPDYQAICYGGYRDTVRTTQPTMDELKEDMLILHAMGIRIVRTYNSQQFAQAGNLVKAISELKEEKEDFEMYVMIGAWIDCKDAWKDEPIHNEESLENNQREIDAAVKLAKDYPDIVKVIAVGNEAMIYWASSYFVEPHIILKWVNYLQNLKTEGELPADLWITSSDNYDSWGGKSERYHTETVNELMEAVDYISLHTYPFHETHYLGDFWGVFEGEEALSDTEKIELAMKRAVEMAKEQYQSVVDYMESQGIDKPVHIGETGWASVDNSLMGPEGTRAADEYKGKIYYDLIRKWTNEAGISCFYFEAFDEKWKDPKHEEGSENHFGLINLNGEVKYVLWDELDAGVFEGLKRNGKALTKTYNGDIETLKGDVLLPPSK